MDPITTTLIAAAVPIVTDLIKTLAGGISRRLGGLSVDDQIRLENAMIERLKALAGLDQPGGVPSQWVVDLRAAFRYVAAAALIVLGSVMILIGAAVKDGTSLIDLGAQIATFPFGFLFGERLVLALRPPGTPANAPLIPARPGGAPPAPGA